jgi:hypothetical protein
VPVLETRIEPVVFGPPTIPVKARLEGLVVNPVVDDEGPTERETGTAVFLTPPLGPTVAIITLVLY